jgi:hypothetical protein
MTDTSALLLVKALSALRGEGLTLEQADLRHNRQRPLIKCPGLISRTLAENSELPKTVRVLFPDDVCDVGNWNRFGAIGVHLMEGSWRTLSGYLRRRLAKRWESTKMQRVLKQSLKLGKTRNQATANHPSGWRSAEEAY